MKRVLLGMSGGVDSSVTAVLLQRQGYEVLGATMLLNEEQQGLDDARYVCQKLGIEYYIIDGKKEFKKYVINNFNNEYIEAKTPNPCVECNKHIKFDFFYKKAKELNCDYIATGHYAKCEYSEKYNQYVLKVAEAEKKDQSYFLYGISKKVLEHVIFPLGNYKSKDEIRELAKKMELPVASKSDSQEICFIQDNNYAKYVCKKCNICPKSGNIVIYNDGKKEIIGKHNGIINYTIGQRKGLGIAYKEPLYVIKINKDNNELVVGTKENLYKKILYANNLNFLIPTYNNMQVWAKIRYRAEKSKAKINFEKDNVKVIFEEPQRAITPGQSVVFYDDDILIGGGIIY